MKRKKSKKRKRRDLTILPLARKRRKIRGYNAEREIVNGLFWRRLRRDRVKRTGSK